MKSTFLKAIKVVALSLALSLATAGVVFANGAGAPPTTLANGAGNGAGTSTTWNKKSKSKRRVAKRVKRRAGNRQTAKA